MCPSRIRRFCSRCALPAWIATWPAAWRQPVQPWAGKCAGRGFDRPVHSAVTIAAVSSSSWTGVSGSAGSAAFSQEGNIFAFFPGLNVGADIHALETKGVVEVLAEPNVMAINGKEASFLAGGEFPYPVVSGTSGGTAAVSIEFKEYGIRLNFIPTITPRGTIRLAGGAGGERTGLHQRSARFRDLRYRASPRAE